MSRLPSHHIRRERLTDRCRSEQVVVVEAAGGYGKSVFARELVDCWGALPIWVLLEEGGVSAQLLAARLRAAVARAGLSDAAGAMAAAGDDPPGAVDAMLAVLDGETCAIVIDDAHHADRDAAALIDRIVGQLAGSQRLIVLARHLPPGLERLRRADAFALGSPELSLTSEETLELCRSGFGLDVSVDEARLLNSATGGWTAAAVLTASRARRTARPLGAVTAARGTHTDAIQAMLEEALSASGPDRAVLSQLARLPLVTPDLLERISGDPGLFDRVLARGLPLSEAGAGWWELPGPVRDQLALLAPSDPLVLSEAAGYYEQRGELGTALQMLLAAGYPDEAAELLAGAEPAHVDEVDVLELLAVVDRIPVAVLDRFPIAILHVARSCQAAALLDQRASLLARASATIDERTPAEVRRAVDVELAIDLVTDGNEASAAEQLAERVVQEASFGEQLTRARALSVLGRAAYWHRDDLGRVRLADLHAAANYLRRASQAYVDLGLVADAAALTPYRAVWIEMGMGRPEAGLEILNQGLALAIARPRRVAYVLLFRAEVLTELGRHEECDADVREVLRIAGQFSDPGQMIAYAHWMALESRSARGDGPGSLESAREAERNTGDWWQVGGADFLADAADCLDRVGYAALAWEYLLRAKETPGDAQPLIAMAECALLARHGDPELAQVRLAEVHSQGIAPREHWRVTLFAACAALRRGDRDAGALAARAFEEAARLGQPQLPLVREREVTESLLGLAVQTGLPAARELTVASLPTALAVFGRFELTHGGRIVSIPAGQAAQLLKLVALSGGRIATEQVIESLWPEVDPAAGRNRLRTVLGRLREAAGEVIRRDGDVLALDSAVRLDLAQFKQEAREALALGRGEATAAAVARSAIARYRGELLPEDLYEDWTQEQREATRSTMLDLLDLCAETAAAAGDLDEARRMVERMVELAPEEDERYLKTASSLLEHASRGAALSVLHRARFALSRLGVEPSPQLLNLERALAA